MLISVARRVTKGSRTLSLSCSNGDALMTTSSPAPESDTRSIGPPSRQRSSQMMSATSTPAEPDRRAARRRG